jgi:hypothetical protein
MMKASVPLNNMKDMKDYWSILSHRREHRWADCLDVTELFVAIHFNL